MAEVDRRGPDTTETAQRTTTMHYNIPPPTNVEHGDMTISGICARRTSAITLLLMAFCRARRVKE